MDEFGEDNSPLPVEPAPVQPPPPRPRIEFSFLDERIIESTVDPFTRDDLIAYFSGHGLRIRALCRIQPEDQAIIISENDMSGLKASISLLWEQKFTDEYRANISNASILKRVLEYVIQVPELVVEIPNESVKRDEPFVVVMNLDSGQRLSVIRDTFNLTDLFTETTVTQPARRNIVMSYYVNLIISLYPSMIPQLILHADEMEGGCMITSGKRAPIPISSILYRKKYIYAYLLIQVSKY